MLNNKVCDPACQVGTCAFDVNDCGYIPITPQPGVGRLLSSPSSCPSSCSSSYIADTQCDSSLCTSDCDAQDCAQVCRYCPTRADDYFSCYGACDSRYCAFQNGVCPICEVPGCNSFNLGNGQCDPACNNTLCRFDLGDCNVEYCAINKANHVCFTSFLGDGRCQPVCNVPECKFDLGDCPKPPPVCTFSSIDVCDPTCDYVLYKFQWGACPNNCTKKHRNCQIEMLGNNICNPECDFPECGMDAGDWYVNFFSLLI